MQDKANSRRTTADTLGISLRTLDRLTESGDGPRPVRVSDRRVVFFDSEIERYKQRKLEAQEASQAERFLQRKLKEVDAFLEEVSVEAQGGGR